jgi:small subunit ribosomal protein S9|nr:ribosomal protein S9 [Protosiphon botryoides]
MQEILARGVGRRKEAVAQVQIVKGTGQFLINNIPVQQYLHNNTCSILSVKAPLNVLSSLNMNTSINGVVTEQNNNHNQADINLSSASVPNNDQGDKDNASLTQFDTIVKVKGGGLVGQAEAIKLGLARALCSLTIAEITTSQDEVRKQLKDKGYLTQDSRVKERRKYGLKKARKATQYNKR